MGGQLMEVLSRGDLLVVASMDRLSRKLDSFANLLDAFHRLGVVLHVPDLGTIDPRHPKARALIESLIYFADQQPILRGMRTRESHATLRASGEWCTRHAPFGTRWKKRGGKTYAVPDPNEQAICKKVAELRIAGYTWHQIRQYLAYEWKVRNRNGKEFGYEEVRKMALRGAALRSGAELQKA
jgi:DNA invertase Pin-like site-specific DNA recombinase